MSNYYLFTALINLACCIGIVWFSICSLNSKRAKDNLLVRAKFAVLLSGALMMGFQPTLTGNMPSKVDSLMSMAVLAYLVLSQIHWKRNNANKP